MEWTADVSAGGLDPRADRRSVARDDARRRTAGLRRIRARLPPRDASKPVDAEWPPLPYDDNRRAWEAFSTRGVEIDTLAARWADAAAAFGTRLHATAQWGALVKATGGEWNPSGWQQTQAPDGWQFDAPMEGRVRPRRLLGRRRDRRRAHRDARRRLRRAVGRVGRPHRRLGHGPSRVLFAVVGLAAEGPTRGRRGTTSSWRTRPATCSTTCSASPSGSPASCRTTSRGTRGSSPPATTCSSAAGWTQLADPEWVLHVPWRDRELEEHGFPPSAHTPSLVWPADRAWVLVTEVDYDSTIVGGTARARPRAVRRPAARGAADPRGGRPGWDADEVNR